MILFSAISLWLQGERGKRDTQPLSGVLTHLI
jgi:hypothetical protein